MLPLGELARVHQIDTAEKSSTESLIAQFPRVEDESADSYLNRMGIVFAEPILNAWDTLRLVGKTLQTQAVDNIFIKLSDEETSEVILQANRMSLVLLRAKDLPYPQIPRNPRRTEMINYTKMHPRIDWKDDYTFAIGLEESAKAMKSLSRLISQPYRVSEAQSLYHTIINFSPNARAYGRVIEKTLSFELKNNLNVPR